MWKKIGLLGRRGDGRNSFSQQNVSYLALEFLARAYEEHGYKAVAMALRKHGPNAAKFRTELRAVELAILQTRSDDAKLAEMVDTTGRAAEAIRNRSFAMADHALL